MFNHMPGSIEAEIGSTGRPSLPLAPGMRIRNGTVSLAPRESLRHQCLIPLEFHLYTRKELSQLPQTYFFLLTQPFLPNIELLG